MSVKISELTSLNQQLTSGDYIPIVHNGATYKYDPYAYVVKNSGDESISGNKTFSGNAIFSGNMLQSITNATTSFTLSALPANASKRIYNSGSSAITITMESGVTCSGVASLPLPAACAIDITFITATTALVTNMVGFRYENNYTACIARKTFTSTTAAITGGVVQISHTLPTTKITNISGTVISSTGAAVSLNTINKDGTRTNHVDVVIATDYVYMSNDATLSTNLCSRPAVINVDYNLL